MKAITVFLAGSALLNLALLGVLLAGGIASSGPSGDDAAAIAASSASVAKAGTKPAVDAQTWSKLDTEKLPDLVARLRAAGFPPRVVQAILRARLTMANDARRRALYPDLATLPFYKTLPRDPKVQLALRQMDREERDAAKELLGSDYEDTNQIMSDLLYSRQQFDPVPPAKLDSVKGVLAQYNDLRQDFYASLANGAYSQEDRKKLTALDQEQHAALAQILSPDELAAWDLRNSNSASSVRYRMNNFDGTEQEFLAIYNAQSAYDARFGPMYSRPSEDEMKARSAAQNDMENQIKAALGPDRYAEYQKTNDYNYQQTTMLVTRLNLPPETTGQVYSIQQDTQKQATALRQDTSLSAADRAQQLAALADSAEAKIGTILGPDGATGYKQYGGQWLNNLRPRPPQSQSNSGGIIMLR